MTARSLRLRALVDRWFGILVGLFVVLALVGAYGSYVAYVAPETTTEERVVGQTSVDGEFAHSATVTRENPVFSTGTELENRSTYFTSASPELDGSYSVAYDAADARNVSVGLDSKLVFNASGDEGETYWRVTEPLEQASATDLRADESVSVPFAVNVSAVDSRLTRIEEQLGDVPGETSVHVAVDVELAGTVDGEQVSLAFTRRLPLSIDGGVYTVTPSTAAPETVQQTETVVVPQKYGPLYTLGAPLVLVVSLGVLGAMVAARGRGVASLTDEERVYLNYLDDRREFSEWLARIRLPPETLERPRAEAESLSDLVDFAIDANTGVVESPDGDSFFVVTDECLVTYEPPSVPDGIRADERPTSTGGVTSGSANGGPTAEQADPGDD